MSLYTPRTGTVTLVMLTLPLLVGFAWPGTVQWWTTRGVKHYRAMHYDRAQESFERAFEHDPDNPVLRHNRAASLYQLGHLDEAAELFTASATTGDGQVRVDSWYGLGNTLYRGGSFETSIDAYRQALREDPSDTEAKHNLEMAQLMLDQQQQEQQQQQGNDPDESDSDGDSPEDREEPSPQQQEEASQDQQPRESPDERQEGTPDQPRPEESDDEALSAEQARRLLRTLTSEDAELQKIIRRQQQKRQPGPGEKDW